MRSVNLRILALLLIAGIIVVSVQPLGVKAIEGEVYGINYKRVYATIREYDVTARVGGFSFPGKITRKANFDVNEVDKYIRLFMEKNDVKGKKLVYCEKTIESAIKQTQLEGRELVGDMTQSIASICGNPVTEDSVAVLRGALESALFTYDTIEATGARSMLTEENVETFFSKGSKYLREKYTTPYGFARNVAEVIRLKFFAKNVWLKAVFDGGDVAKFLHDSFSRWERLEPIWKQGYEAKAFLDDFYRRLNSYLDTVFQNRATFMLTVSGDRTRVFKFLGTDPNFQYWSVCFLLGRERPYGNRKYSPAGEYRGTAVIALSHFMWGFDTVVWELPIGPLDEWWFVKATAVIINDVQIVNGDYSGYSYISRVIESNDARLTVFASEGNGSGNVRLTAKMDMSKFKDTIRTSSSQKVTLDSSVGFADSGGNVGAAMFADVKMHLEGNEFGTFDLVLDKANAKFQSVLGINVDEKQGTRLVARVWDSNIWAPLQSKTVSFDIRGNILEEAIK